MNPPAAVRSSGPPWTLALVVVSGRITTGASSPLEPCTVMTRTSPLPSSCSRFTSTSLEAMSAAKLSRSRTPRRSAFDASARKASMACSASRPRRVRMRARIERPPPSMRPSQRA